VVPGGYVWRENIYASLSIIARAITGTAWNGPRFFGLRTRRDESEGAVEGHAAGPDRPRRPFPTAARLGRMKHNPARKMLNYL
jgi:Protein of unknown function (DUF2924)